MKKLIVAILVSLSVAAFAEDFSWADFEVLVLTYNHAYSDNS